MYKDRDDYERFWAEVNGLKTDSRRCRPDQATCEALNNLQSIQWEINLDFLVKLFDINFEGGEGTSFQDVEIGLRSGSKYLKKIGKYVHNITAKDALTGGNGDHGGFFDEEFQEEMVTTLDWIKKIVNHNANVFWHAWYCDFRGRLYPRCPGLSPVGGDLDKALIRFKKWKPMGKGANDSRGINWFRRYLHNLMEGVEGPWGRDLARKGISFEAREKWVIKHQDTLMEMGDNPLSEKNVGFLGLNKPKVGKEDLQRVAALIEFDRIMQEYNDKRDWSKVESGLPVSLDGSCNGYQHISTLLRNPKLAKSVNVINGFVDLDDAGDNQDGEEDLGRTKEQGRESEREDGEEKEPDKAMGDLYEIVAQEAKKTKTAKDLKEYLKEMMIQDGNKDDSEAKRLAEEMMDRVFSRKVAKKPTMTRAYGSTSFNRALAGKNQQGAMDQSLPQQRNFDQESKDFRNHISTIAPKFENAWFEYQQNPRSRRNRKGKKEDHYARHAKVVKSRGELARILKKHTESNNREQNEQLLGKYDFRDKKNKKRKLHNLTKSNLMDIIDKEKSIKESIYLDWKDKKNRKKLLKEAKKWGSQYFREEETLSLWAQGSGLHSALSANKELWGLFRYSKESPVDGSGKLWRLQPEITKEVSKAYAEGIDEATGSAYKKFEKIMKDSVRESQGRYPGVRWITKSMRDSDENGFEVSNYYMKTETGGGRRGWPSHPNSCYSHMGSIPDWYSEDKGKKELGNFETEPFSRLRVREKIDRFMSDLDLEVPDFFATWWNRGDDRGRDMALSWLERESEIPGSEEFARKCKALIGHISILVPEYADNEFDIFIAKCGVTSCKWEERSPIASFETKDRREIIEGLENRYSKCGSCGSEIESSVKVGRIDFKAAERGVCPNFIHSLDACHMRTAINQFRSKVGDFGFFAVHDSFGTHACDVEEMKDTVVNTFWEMHRDRSLRYWISNLEGPDGKITLDEEEYEIMSSEKDLKIFRESWGKSEYLIA